MTDAVVTASRDGNRKAVILAIDRALRRELPVLARRPDLVRQQLSNRLQWAEAPVREALRRELECPSGTPQLRPRAPFHEAEALLQTLSHGYGSVLCCAVSQNGALIASGDHFHDIFLWSVPPGQLLGRFTGHTDAVNGCAISPDGSFVASGSADSAVVLFEDVAPGKLTAFYGHDGPVNGCAFSPDASFVASAGADGTLRLWDVPGGDEKAAVALPSGLQCVALHPHLPMAVCGDHAGGVHLIDLGGVEYGALVITAVDAHDRPGDPVILCPKCRTLLTGSRRLLGETVACPARACDAELRINPFVASSPTPGSSTDDAEWLLADPPPGKKRLFGKKRG